MKNYVPKLVLCIVFVGVFSLTACTGAYTDPSQQEYLSGNSGGGGGGSRGILTITNCPAKVNALGVYSNSNPKTQWELLEAIRIQDGFFVASFSDTSPFPLLNIDYTPFTRTGLFLVIATGVTGGGNYFKANVSFTNGSATFDFSSMTSQTSLPGSPFSP
jgi:hypothetical protein